MAWRGRCRKVLDEIRSRETYMCSVARAANKRHSAYSFRTARIAYRWHPLFGQTLQVSSHRRGKDLQCIYTDERPDLSRELPVWMFDEGYCVNMALGEPQISIDGLLKFAAALEACTETLARGARLAPSRKKEKESAKKPLSQPGPACPLSGNEDHGQSAGPKPKGTCRSLGRPSSCGNGRSGPGGKGRR